MTRTIALIALSLIGCAASSNLEDSADDAFLGGDGKADAFGIEDWSPDGAAVLTLVSTADTSKLHDDVGLSTRVTKGIIAKRDSLANGTFTDLKDLDAVPYVGKTVFNHLLTYVTQNHLFKTAIRLPLIVENQDDDTKVPITTYNAQATAAGKAGFAEYTFVDADAGYDVRADSYTARLGELNVPGVMLQYAYQLSDFNVGSQHVCFIGDPAEVSDALAANADSVVGDMYSIWGFRYKNTKWGADSDTEDALNNVPDWTNYDTSSTFVRILASDSDDGDTSFSDDVPPCR